MFLSRSVLKCVRENPNTTGTEIAYKILELYKRFSEKVDFKNVQRRVYDALNVLSAMEIIEKHKNHIVYNPKNEFIDDDILPNTVPKMDSDEDELEISPAAKQAQITQRNLDTKKRKAKLVEKQQNL